MSKLALHAEVLLPVQVVAEAVAGDREQVLRLIVDLLRPWSTEMRSEILHAARSRLLTGRKRR